MNDTQVQGASSWANGSLWLIVVFIGAFVLVGAIAWSRRKNQGITPRQHEASEQATRDLYRDQDADDKAGRH